jgi:glutamine synthetase
MVAVTDLDGALCGKHMSVDKFLAAAEGGLAFCNVVLGWDSADEVIENTTRCGWDTGFPDKPTRIDLTTCRELPGERSSFLFLADFDGEEAALSPRSTLRRVLARAVEAGFEARAAFEYEFFLFSETPATVREKGFRDLQPIAPGAFGYSTHRSLVWGDLYDEILATAEAWRLPIEGLHEESGPGVLEAALAVDEALEAADRGALFKTAMKVLAQRRGLMATFMSRWSESWPGQSGHIHLSLWGSSGSAFHDPSREASMSETMRHFVGGQQVLMPELLAMVAPTVNSYTRLVPGHWAPTSATWGVENRTCALRVVPGSEKSQRVEYRVAGAEGNPYLALAAALGSGLWGIENGIEPSEPVTGNAYDRDAGDCGFPQTLWEATQRLRRSDAAAELFGAEFVEHFAATREWEERRFRQAVTNWELERYFETS